MKATGKIVKMEGNLVEDAGWSENDPVVEGTLAMLPSCYDSTSWNIKGSIVKTDKPSNTWCRSPGTPIPLASKLTFDKLFASDL